MSAAVAQVTSGASAPVDPGVIVRLRMSWPPNTA